MNRLKWGRMTVLLVIILGICWFLFQGNQKSIANVVSKISKTLNHIDNGDVVVFHEDAQRDFIKRVIGTPGDKVEYEGDQLYVNDKRYQSLI